MSLGDILYCIVR